MSRAQIWSAEVFIAVLVFLVSIVLFYSFVSVSQPSQKNEDAEQIIKSTPVRAMFEDSMLTEKELRNLSTFNCSELKLLFETHKNICIYFKDSEGNLINISGDMLSIGCPELEIGGKNCGE